MAEHGEDRGQNDERDRGGHQRDQRAADAHRVEEPLREDEQRGERAGDGQRAEQDGAPGGRHRPAHRREAGPGLRDLLAVARDDEQAVVDRQPEPEPGDQVEGEDRDRAELAGDPQHDQRADDREAADEQRQQRGDEAAEEEQREHEEDRKRVELGGAQVLFGLLVDLGLGDGGPARPDAGLAGERFDDLLGRILGLVVLGRLERDGEVGRIALPRDEVGGTGGQEARDLGDVGIGFELVRQLADPLSALRCADVGVVDEDHDADVAIARRLQPLVGDHALGVGIVGAVGVESVGDAGAERGGQNRERDRRDHDPLPASLGEAREPVEHQAALLGLPSPSSVARSLSASSAHQPATKSLKAMPKRSVV